MFVIVEVREHAYDGMMRLLLVVLLVDAVRYSSRRIRMVADCSLRDSRRALVLQRCQTKNPRLMNDRLASLGYEE